MRVQRPLLFIPTFNERENVAITYGLVKALNLDVDLLFMDDSSPDGTGDVLEELRRTDDRLTVVHRASKQGIGSAHRAGIRYAYEKGYSILVTMDCDLTHPVSEIPRFLALSDQADIVLASRFLSPDSLSDWSASRKLLTKLGHALTRLVLRVPYDATGGFRLYRVDRIDPNVFGLATSDGYSFLFESLYFLWRCGVNVKEIPIILPKRTYGHSKMSIRDIYMSLATLFDLYIRSRRSGGAIRAIRAEQGARNTPQNPLKEC